MNRAGRTATLLVLLVMLTACSAGDEPAADYLHRLQNVLDTEQPVRQAPAIRAFPAARDLHLLDETQADGAPPSISVREFLGLRECRLHLAIAEKNSVMGRVASESQALFTDLAILQDGPGCIALLKANQQSRLAENLAQLLKHKKNLLDHRLWSAILGSGEARAFWSTARRHSDYPNELSNQPVQALQQLDDLVVRIRAGDWQFDSVQQTEFENLLKDFSGGDGGALLRALTSLRHNLAIANASVNARLERRLCLTGNPTPTARNFANVVEQFFIPEVQLKSVQYQRRHTQLITIFNQLETRLLNAAPKVYRDWAAQRQQQFEIGLRAAQQHVEQVQKLYQQCGLRAGDGR